MIYQKGYLHNHAKMALVIYCTMQMLSGSRNSPFYICLEMFWILNNETQETFNFQTFHLTSLHLHKKIFHTKNGKGYILTLMTVFSIDFEVDVGLWQVDVAEAKCQQYSAETGNLTELT